jgi:hypothetical protein
MTKHPTIEPLRCALRDLLTAAEDYMLALTRPSVSVIVTSDAATQADLVEKARELGACREQARMVLMDLAERLAEDDRATTPVLPDAHDDASDEARATNASLSDDDIAVRTARAARLFGGRK